MADRSKKGIKNRAYWVFGGVMVLVCVIVFKLVKLKFITGDYWRKQITQNSIKYKPIEPERGNILAADGSILATSLPEYWLYMDTKVQKNTENNTKFFNKNIDEFCGGLASILGEKSPSEYKKMIKKAAAIEDRDLKLCSKRITFFQKVKIKKLALGAVNPFKSGLTFEQHLIRNYPYGNMAQRTIGMVQKDKNGKVIGGKGIEYSFNNDLAGMAGFGLHESMKGGRQKLLEDEAYKKPVEGFDLYTTLDVNIQDEAETALKLACETYQPNYGSVVVMEVATGEIKAMANLAFSKALNKYAETDNFAIAASTTPGSTIKGPTMLALLEEGVDNKDSVNRGNGTLSFKGGFSLNDHGHGGFITAQQAFEQSSNVGIVKFTMDKFGDRPSKYYEYLDKFGLTKLIGFQMLGEKKPIFYPPSHKRYSGLSLPWTAFGGYESALSPLQILTFYNAVANDGYWVQPIIVKESKSGQTVMKDYKLSQRIYEERIATKTSIDKLKLMLEGVVNKGTAKHQKSKIYSFAGKTGTSVKNKKSANGPVYYCAFVGYFPAEAPRYSCIVVIDEPKGKSNSQLMAADVAAPVFRQIADNVFADDLIFNQKNVLATGQQLEVKRKAALQEDYRYVKANFPGNKIKMNEVVINPNIKSPKYKTPNVVGLPLRDALYVLENKDFKIKYKGIGKVKNQSVAVGAMVPAGQEITLQLN